ncbi:beta-galactosidase small subunit-related protein, partial [Kineococcus sp. SYSU DK018]|uniref:hypothetical protein n=1 Tax=Kineococcus sp. SYSU DK018 TaxID=3383139 RepID=UPI003D7CF477
MGFAFDVPTNVLEVSLPRPGVRLCLPHGLDAVTWFSRGPGEPYSDTGAARPGACAWRASRTSRSPRGAGAPPSSTPRRTPPSWPTPVR